MRVSERVCAVAPMPTAMRPRAMMTARSGCPLRSRPLKSSGPARARSCPGAIPAPANLLTLPPELQARAVHSQRPPQLQPLVAGPRSVCVSGAFLYMVDMGHEGCSRVV